VVLTLIQLGGGPQGEIELRGATLDVPRYDDPATKWFNFKLQEAGAGAGKVGRAYPLRCLSLAERSAWEAALSATIKGANCRVSPNQPLDNDVAPVNRASPPRAAAADDSAGGAAAAEELLARQNGDKARRDGTPPRGKRGDGDGCSGGGGEGDSKALRKFASARHIVRPKGPDAPVARPGAAPTTTAGSPSSAADRTSSRPRMPSPPSLRAAAPAGQGGGSSRRPPGLPAGGVGGGGGYDWSSLPDGRTTPRKPSPANPPKGDQPPPLPGAHTASSALPPAAHPPASAPPPAAAAEGDSPKRAAESAVASWVAGRKLAVLLGDLPSIHPNCCPAPIELPAAPTAAEVKRPQKSTHN
jgi:hypothetical protein